MLAQGNDIDFKFCFQMYEKKGKIIRSKGLGSAGGQGVLQQIGF